VEFVAYTFYSAVFEKQLLKEAAVLSANLNADDDMPELFSVTPLNEVNVTATSHNERSSSFEKYIFDLDETGTIVQKQVDVLRGESSGSNAHCGEVDEVERMALQIGLISCKDWELMQAAYLANLES
jgi:hypothetical protein